MRTGLFGFFSTLTIKYNSTDNPPKEQTATMRGPFKILDRYIIRKFLGTYVFAIILILAITVMFDVN